MGDRFVPLAHHSCFVLREHNVPGVVDHDLKQGPLFTLLEDMMDTPTVLDTVSDLSGVTGLSRFVGRLMFLSTDYE